MTEHGTGPLGSFPEGVVGASEPPRDLTDDGEKVPAVGGASPTVGRDPVEDPELPPRTSMLIPDPNDAAVVVSRDRIQQQRYAGREQELFERRRALWRDAPWNLQLPEAVEWWTASQVAAWVNALGWGRHASGFMANNINGEALLMVDNHMLKDIGVNALGDRLLLLRARDMLLAEQGEESQARRKEEEEEEEIAADKYGRISAPRPREQQQQQY